MTQRTQKKRYPESPLEPLTPEREQEFRRRMQAENSPHWEFTTEMVLHARKTNAPFLNGDMEDILDAKLK